MNGFAKLWGGPLAVGAATTAGLLGALLFEGAVAQIAGCAALAAPVALLAWKLAFVKRRG